MKFVKYMGCLFFLLMVLNLTVLLPLYAYGIPNSAYRISDFSLLTILNASGSKGRLWVSFVFILLNSLIAYLLVYLFWRTSLRLKHLKHIHNSAVMSEKDIALHTVWVKNFPRSIDPKSAQEELSSILKISYGNQIVSVKVVG
jgi:hypothetical protein